MPKNEIFAKFAKQLQADGMPLSAGVLYNNMHNQEFFDKVFETVTADGLQMDKQTFAKNLGLGTISSDYKTLGIDGKPNQLTTKTTQSPTIQTKSTVQPKPTAVIPNFNIPSIVKDIKTDERIINSPLPSATSIKTVPVKPSTFDVSKIEEKAKAQEQAFKGGYYPTEKEQPLIFEGKQYNTQIRPIEREELPKYDKLFIEDILGDNDNFTDKYNSTYLEKSDIEYQKNQANQSGYNEFNYKKSNYDRQFKALKEYESKLNQSISNKFNTSDILTDIQKENELLNSELSKLETLKNTNAPLLKTIESDIALLNNRYQNGQINENAYRAEFASLKAKYETIGQEINKKTSEIQEQQRQFQSKYSDKEVLDLLRVKQKQFEVAKESANIINDPKFAKIKEGEAKTNEAQKVADNKKKLEIQLQNKEIDFNKYATEVEKLDKAKNVQINTQAFIADKTWNLFSQILTLPRTISGNFENNYGFVDKVADWANHISEVKQKKNPYSSDIQVNTFQKFAQVGDLRVLLDEKGNAYDVRDNRYFSIDQQQAEQALKQYNENKKGYKIYNQTNADAFTKNALSTIADVGILILGTKGLGSLAGGGKLASTLIGGGVAFTQIQNDLYKQGIESGLNPQDASQFATKVGTSISLISFINPTEYKLAGAGGLFPSIRQNVISQADVALINSGEMSITQIASKYAKGIAKNIVGENFEELIGEPLAQDLISNLYESRIANDGEGFTKQFDPISKQGLETLLLTSVVAIPFGAAEVTQEMPHYQAMAMQSAIENPQAYIDVLKKRKEMGIIDDAQMNAQLLQMQEISEVYNSISSEIKDERKPELAGLLAKKNVALNKIKDIKDDVLSNNWKSKLEKINEDIQAIVDNVATKNNMVASDGIESDVVESDEVESKTKQKEPIKVFSDFDNTLFDPTTQTLTPLGEEMKLRIEAGEDIEIVTARENTKENIDLIVSQTGIDPSKITLGLTPEMKAEKVGEFEGKSQFIDDNAENIQAVSGLNNENVEILPVISKKQALRDKLTAKAKANEDAKNIKKEELAKSEAVPLNEKGDVDLPKIAADAIDVKVEEIKVEEKKPIQISDTLTNEEFLDFIDNDTISVERLENIANKQANGVKLTPKEETIKKAKQAEIQSIIDGKKIEKINQGMPEISADELNNIFDSGKVSDDRANDIAKKLINGEELSKREKSVFENNTKVINKKVDELKPLLEKRIVEEVKGEVAREIGEFTKDGITYKRQSKKTKNKGKKDIVKFAEKVSMPFTYQLMEADDVQGSHINGNRNPLHFIKEAQPKERNDAGSNLASNRIAENMNFDEVSQSSNAYSGAPIVNEFGEVIQGNNRIEGIKKHYKSNQEKYKNDLIENAEQFGLTKEQVIGMKSPILVRTLSVTDEKAIELGNYDAKDIETGGKRGLDPIAITSRMSDSDKANLAELATRDDEKTINSNINKYKDEIINTIKKYLNTAQMVSLTNSVGELTVESVKGIEEIVKQLLFDKSPEVLMQSELFSSVAKKGLTKSLQFIFGVPTENQLIQETQKAISLGYLFIKSNNADFSLFLLQKDLFSNVSPNEQFTKLEIELAKILLNAKKESDVFLFYKEYKNEVLGKEGDMFSDPTKPKTKQEIINERYGKESKETNKGETDKGKGDKGEGAGSEVGNNAKNTKKQTVEQSPKETPKAGSVVGGDVEAKKADIERRRQEELDKANKQIEKTDKKEDRRVKVETYRTLDIGGNPVEVEITTNADGSRLLRARQVNEDGSIEPMAYTTERINNKSQATLTNEKLVEGYIGNEDNTLERTNVDENPNQTHIDKINAKYDAELAALEGAKPAETTPISDKKADIERRRQEELESDYKQDLAFALKNFPPNYLETVSGKNFKKIFDDRYYSENIDRLNRINAKYDAELKALEQQPTTTTQTVTAQPEIEAKKADIERSSEDFANENESYRVIVGDEAFNDIVESGVVRTNADNKNTNKQDGVIDLSGRPTAFPSFSKGSASMSYAKENPNHYIIVTEDPSIQPSKSGRHGKGNTMFPTDENGKHLKELNGSKVKVYKHIGGGKYELIYANGKKINAKYGTELEKIQPKETTKAVISEIKTKNLTHVRGKDMGENQSLGTFVSTEENNRYETPTQKAEKVDVEIENPLVVVGDYGLLSRRQEILNENRGKFTAEDSNDYEDLPNRKLTVDDLNDDGIKKLATLTTEILKAQGYDSIYFRESDTQEGELVVFDKKKVTFKENNKEVTNVAKITPVTQNGKTIIDENGNLTDELSNQFEQLKKDNNLNGLDNLYSTVKIFLNGIAQSKGENTVEQFQKLKKEIEEHAKELKKEEQKPRNNNQENLFSTSTVDKEKTTAKQKKEVSKIIEFFNKMFGFNGFASFDEFADKLKSLGYDSLQAMVEAKNNGLIAIHNINPISILNANELGGIAMPSIAITDVNNPFDSFGSISLLASKNLIDPKQSSDNKVFGSDVYSARYPSITYVRKGYTDTSLFNDKERESIASNSINNDIENGGIDRMSSNTYIKQMYLISKGIKVPYVSKGKEISSKYINKFKRLGLDKLQHWQLKESKEFNDLALEYFKENNSQETINAGRFIVDGLLNQNLVNNYAYTFISDSKEFTDEYETSKKVDKLIEKDIDGYNKFAKQQYEKAKVEEKIFKGYTYNGTRKYVPHTLANVIKEMKADGVRNGEKFGYGAGSVRATITKQFKSVQDIINSKDKLVANSEFEKVKDEINKELIELLEEIKPYYKYEGGFGYYDDAGTQLNVVANRGQSEAFNKMPIELQNKVAEFLNKLQNAPTQYFEAKITRPVGISEFDTAIVPKGTANYVLQILKDAGLNIVEYRSKEDRQEKIKQQSEKRQLQFLKTPSGKVLGFVSDGKIYLNPNALTAETAFHELAHVQQAFIKIAAQKGDKIAQAVRSRWDRLMQENDVLGQIAKFDKGMKSKGTPLQAQIIGEQGASRLENAEAILDDLRVAKEMETAGKDAKTIRLATSWEKGVDGKWRFEHIPRWKLFLRTKFNQPELELTNGEKAEFHNGTVEDFLGGGKELLKAYPEIANITVDIYIGGVENVKGEYLRLKSGGGKQIELFAKNKEQALSGLIHEIQHAIQDIEGFAKGGNPTQFEVKTIDRVVEIAQDIASISTNLFESLPENLKPFARKINRNEDTDGSAYKEIAKNKEAKIIWADYTNAINQLKELKGKKDIITISEYEQYKRLVGEVEARNAQTRANMTLEERKAKMLSETEDVSREDQIVLFNAINGKETPRIIKIKDGLKTIKIDLSSSVYDQSENESDADYEERIMNEVWSYLTDGENAKKWNEANKKGGSKLWNFVQAVANFFKEKLGLKDLTIDQILNSSLKDLIEHTANGLMKGEWFDMQNENGMDWVETPIGEQQLNKPVVAFQISDNQDTLPFETNDKTNATKQNIQDKFPDAIVVQSESELPLPIQNEIKQQRAEGKVKGIFYNGKVYMVASNIKTIGEATGTYRHEKLGHKGAIEHLKDKLDAYATRIIDNAKGEQLGKLKQLAKRYGLPTDLTKLTPKQKSDLGQEYVAMISENKSKYPKLWNDLVSFVREAIRMFGIKLQVTDTEIQALIGKVEKNIKTKNDLSKNGKSQFQLNTPQAELNNIKEKAIADGTFMKAPNGKTTNLNENQWLQVRTKSFKEWFGNWENDPKNASKVIDVNGEPMVVYHGTSKKINVFDKNTIGKNFKQSELGFYFTNEKTINDSGIYGTTAEEYARNSASNGYGQYAENEFENIIEVFLSIQSPLVLNDDGWYSAVTYLDKNTSAIKRWLKNEDGVIATLLGEEGEMKDGQQQKALVVFEPNQIKSATDNVGTFDAGDNDIRFQLSNDATQKFDPKNKTHIEYSDMLNEYVDILIEEGEIPTLESFKEFIDEDTFNEIVNELGIPFIEGKFNTPFVENLKLEKLSKEQKDSPLVKRGQATLGEDARQEFDEIGRTYTADKWKEIEPQVDAFVQKVLGSRNFTESVKEIMQWMKEMPMGNYLNEDGIATAHTMILNKLTMHSYTLDKELFKEIFKFAKIRGTSFGQAIAAYAEASTPESLFNNAIGDLEIEKEEILNTVQPSGQTLKQELDLILQQISIKADEITEVLSAIESQTKSVATKTRNKGTKTSTPKAQSNFVPRSKETKTKAKIKIDDAKARLAKWLEKQNTLSFAYDPNADLKAHQELLGISKDFVLGFLEYGYASVLKIKENLQSALGKNVNVDDFWHEVYDDEVRAKVKDLEKEQIVNAIVNAIKEPGETKETTAITQISRILAGMAKNKNKSEKSNVPIDEQVRLLFENKDIASESLKEALRVGIEQINNNPNLSDEQKLERTKTLQDMASNFTVVPEAVSRKAIQSGLKSIEETIESIAKKHYLDAEDAKQNLIDKLVLNANLSHEDAVQYADILSKELEKQVSEKKAKLLDKLLNPTTKKAGNKKEIEKIIDAINLGALSSDEFASLFAKKFGFRSITPQQIQFLQNTISIMFQQKGIMKRRIARTLADYIASLKPLDARNVGMLIQEIFYQHALGGINTVALNIPTGSTLSVMANMIPVIAKNPMLFIKANLAYNRAGLGGTGIKAFIDTLQTGFNDVDNFVDEKNFLTSGSRYHKFLLSWGFKDPQNFITSVLYKLPMHIGYFASAFDNLINHRGGEILNYMHEYQSTDKSYLTIKEIHKQVETKMGYDDSKIYSSTVNDEILDMEANGLTIPTGYKEQRVKELMVETRNRDIQQQAYRLIRSYGLMGKPDGISGAIYRAIAPAGIINDKDSNLTAIVKTIASVTLLPFLRISFASMGMLASGIPVIGMGLGSYKLEKNEQTKRNEFSFKSAEEIKQLAGMQAMTIGALIFGFMEMFDMEDDENGNTVLSLNKNRSFDITGTNISFFDQDKMQLDKGNYLPLSIRFRKNDGTFGKLHEVGRYMPPIVAVMSILGNLRDKIEIQSLSKLDEEGQIKTTYANKEMVFESLMSIYGGLTVTSYNSLAQFVGKSADIIGYKNKSPQIQSDKKIEDTKKLLFNTAARPLKTLALPNIYRDITKNTEALLGSQKTMDSQYKNILKDFYGLDHLTNHLEVDIFGNKVMQTASFGEDDRYNLPEWKLLRERNIVFDTPYFYKTAKFDGEKKNITNEQRLKLNDKASIAFGNYIRENIEYLKGLNQVELIQEFDNYADHAKRDITSLDFNEAIK